MSKKYEDIDIENLFMSVGEKNTMNYSTLVVPQCVTLFNLTRFEQQVEALATVKVS